MIVVGIIGLLAEIAIPNYVEARSTASKSTCINNLRMIDGAKQQWALEELRSPTAVPTYTEIAEFIWRGADSTKTLACPQDPAQTFETSYKQGDLINLPECLIRGDAHILVE